MRALSLLLLAACSSSALVAPLPPLDGMQTLLVGEPGARTLRAIALPADNLRFDLPIELTAGVHGNALLYERSIAEMGLPVSEGVLALLESRDLDPLPRPDHALSLGEDLTWREEDATPWTLRRIEPLRCLAFDNFDQELGVRGEVFMAQAYSPTEVLLGLDAGHLLIVSRTRVREVPDLVPANATTWRASVDDAGHIWIAYSAYFAATGTIAEGPGFTFVELDRELRMVSETRAMAGADGVTVDNMVIGRFEGRVEIFVLATPSSLPPRVHRWREGETTTFRLPFPAASDVISDCPNIGIFRSSLSWDGPDRASFIVRQGNVQHYADGEIVRERIGNDACGGALGDDTVASGIAMLMNDRPDTPTQQFRLFGRDDAGWEESPLLLGPSNGFDLVSWLGRTFTTGNEGRIVEIVRAAGGGFRVCPAAAISTTLRRVSRLVAMGGELLVVGDPGDGAPTHVHWVKPK